MATIRFNIKPKGTKLQIRAIFQNGTQQITKNLGESIPANKLKEKYKYWDDKNQQVRNLDEAGRINSTIEKWSAAFATYKDDCKRYTRKIDIQEFLATLDGQLVFNPREDVTLLSVITSYLASIRQSHKPKTYNGYNVLKTQLEKYQQHIKKEIMVSDINEPWYKAFSLYLIEKETNFNAVINRKQSRIITILSYAINDLKIKTVNPDYKKRYGLKQTQAPKFPLLPGELEALWKNNTPAHIEALYTTLQQAQHRYSQLKPTTDEPKKARGRAAIAEAESAIHHQKCKDAFLLACETGLRYSDVTAIKPVNIRTHAHETGIIRYIDLTQVKGDKANKIPLSDRAGLIIDRYAPLVTDKEPIFKFSASQAIGKILRVIFQSHELDRPCEIVKKKGIQTIREIKPLDEIISFHMARNTYITRLLSSGVAPVFVQANAGHSNIKTTMQYHRTDDMQRWVDTLKILN